MRNTVHAHGTVLLCTGLLLVTLLCMVAGLTAPRVAASEDTVLHLPLVFKIWPPLPEAPALAPVDNADGDGGYTVSWSGAARAEDYELQERREAEGWFTAYLGAATHVDLTNRPAGTYTYRCRGRNSWGEGRWSNEVAAVVQGTSPGTMPRPSCSHISAGGMSKVKVINDCPYVLHLDFTGPQPLTMELPKCDVCKVYSIIGPIMGCPTANRPIQEQALMPGDYRLFVTVNNPSVRPYQGDWALSGDCRYSVCFYIVTSWSIDDGAQRQLVPGSCD